MEFVKRKAMQFKAKSGLEAKQTTNSAPSTSSLSLKDGIAGFDEVVRLVGVLTGEPSDQRLVISIAGMGGLGKTSLAKTVYTHSSLEYHFDVCLWATISQQYSAENILTILCGQIAFTAGENDSELGEQLYKRLWGRRYLILLDDMWNEGAWDVVQKYLPDNGNGSRVIVTTRLSDLAARLNSTRFELNFLDEDKSWELFCRKTFGEEDCPVELEKIGKKIVQRCRGLPLSIVVVGGHLRKFSRACLKVCKKENFLRVVLDTTQATSCKERRLVILKGGKRNFEMIGAKQSTPLLRSLVHQGVDKYFLSELPADCRLIRVVHNCITWEETCSPLAHFQQVNLRAFILKQKNSGPHTANLGACWNLQTLFLMSFNFVPMTPPFEIWEMSQLRHLHLIGPGICLSRPVLVERSKQQECIVLENLHTLYGAVNLRLTGEVCKRMPNLKNLWVSYNNFRDDYCFHNLGCFNKLKRLQIYFHLDSKWCDVVLGLTLPASLEELSLTNGHLKWEDLTMMLTSLPHLGLLRLDRVCGSEWNLDAEEFSCLKRLEICNCNDLVYLNANCSHFPFLESLHLSKIHRMNEIPLDIGEIPTLQLIRLEGCSASIAFSAMRMVIEQETNGNYDLQLYVYFEAHEEFEIFQKMLRQECVNSNSLHLYYRGMKIKIF